MENHGSLRSSFLNVVINWQMETVPECGRVAQWTTRLTTDQKIPGSTPGSLEFFAILRTRFVVKSVRHVLLPRNIVVLQPPQGKHVLRAPI